FSKTDLDNTPNKIGGGLILQDVVAGSRFDDRKNTSLIRLNSGSDNSDIRQFCLHRPDQSECFTLEQVRTDQCHVRWGGPGYPDGMILRGCRPNDFNPVLPVQ